MIRLAYRQFRTQGLVLLGALVVLALLTAVTGPHLVHLYDTLIRGCQAAGDCTAARNSMRSTDGNLRTWLDALVLAVPAILGIFWGAPLIARELETGTYRLVWTQSVTRTRWLAVKLGLVGLASMAVAGLTSLMVTWWASPIDRATVSGFGNFDKRDIVPIAYTAFAFALGATLGLVIRRTLPAMAATLVGFVGVRLAIVKWVRPRLATPVRMVSPFRLPSPGGNNVGVGLKAGDWMIHQQTINASGRVIGDNGGLGANGVIGINVTPSGRIMLSDGQSCPGRIHGPIADPQALVTKCLSSLHLREVLTYQPVSRYWSFQWYESGIFLGLALLLVAFCFWWLCRHSAGRAQGGRGDLRRMPSPTPARQELILDDPQEAILAPRSQRPEGPGLRALPG
jgi:hypothetical protein